MRRERGLALVLTAVLGTIAFAIWALSFRATLDTVRAERRLVKRAERDGTIKRALAIGIGLLRTGAPEESFVTYRVTVGEGEDAAICAVTFQEKNKKTWDLEVRLATEAEAALLPDLPESFDS